MIRPSFVPPPQIRQLRDVTRYHCDLVEVRTAEKQRVEKLLEDAQIKLSVVASDIFGVSGRDMMAALINGQRDPCVLARMARGRMRGKITQLEEAFTGYFTDHHAMLLTTMLARIDGLTTDIAKLDARIEEMVAPFGTTVHRIDEIPGLGAVGTCAILAEIGLDMTRFPTAGHLASWAKFTPRVSESAGKRKGQGSTGHGNRYLAKVLGEAAVAAGKTDTFLGERYRRIARRRGKNKAIVAVGRSILIIIWHLLSDPQARFNDLGPTSTTSASIPNAENEPTFTNLKPSATRSPSSQPPDLAQSPSPNPAPLTLRRVQPLPVPGIIFGSDPGASLAA